MKKTIVRLFAFMGFMSFLSFLATVAFIVAMVQRQPELPDKAILVLDFAQTLTAAPDASGWQQLLTGKRMSILDYADAIRRAGDDARIKGLYANLSFADADLAMLEEIRAAIAYFRSKDKWAVAFADTMGEGGNALGVYYLASCFDEVWLQPTGGLSLMGIGVETPFFRKTLASIGLEADFGRRHEYKTAMNSLTEDGFTDAHREETLSLIQALYDTLQAGITSGRPHLLESAQGLDAALARAPFSASEALSLGLIDGVGYEREVLETLTRRVWGEKATLAKSDGWLGIDDYRRHGAVESLTAAEDKPILALVPITGPIVRTVEDNGFSSSEDMANAQKIAEAVLEAADEPSIKAILVRVDSPGGSYVASDTIRHALLYAKEKKPLVVSMGSYAASGGYYVAMDGHKVFANALSITGSIGVFGGKLVAGGLLGDIDATVERLGIGERAFMWSPMTRFNESERQAFDAMLDSVYSDFTAKVAQARRIESIDTAARGRVWTGEQAVAKKLVDRIGTFHDALAAAKTEAGLPADAEVELVLFPAAENPFQALFSNVFAYQPALAFVSRLMLWTHLSQRGDAAMLLPFSAMTF